MQSRPAYPSDVSDEEWALVAPSLTLLPETAAQREHSLREVFNVVRYGVAWRAMPHDLPPWHAVSDQAQRWLRAGCFENLVHDLRAVLRLAPGRTEEPSAVVLDSRTLRSTPESGTRAAWDGHKRTRGSKLHAAVDSLGQVLALHVTPAKADDRAAVATLADAVQEATGDSVRGPRLRRSGQHGRARGKGGRRSRHRPGSREAIRARAGVVRAARFPRVRARRKLLPNPAMDTAASFIDETTARSG